MHIETLKGVKLINILMMGKMPQSVPIVITKYREAPTPFRGFAIPTQTKGCAFFTILNIFYFLNNLYYE